MLGGPEVVRVVCFTATDILRHSSRPKLTLAARAFPKLSRRRNPQGCDGGLRPLALHMGCGGSKENPGQVPGPNRPDLKKQPSYPVLKKEGSSSRRDSERSIEGGISFPAMEFPEVVTGKMECMIPCPAGFFPGEMLKVELPDGSVTYTTIPKGARMGQLFKAQLPNKRKSVETSPSGPGSLQNSLRQDSLRQETPDVPDGETLADLIKRKEALMSKLNDGTATRDDHRALDATMTEIERRNTESSGSVKRSDTAEGAAPGGASPETGAAALETKVEAPDASTPQTHI